MSDNNNGNGLLYVRMRQVLRDVRPEIVARAEELENMWDDVSSNISKEKFNRQLNFMQALIVRIDMVIEEIKKETSK